MATWRDALRHWAFVPLTVATALALWLLSDGRLHWDEPSYLYAAAYQDVDQILAGGVQPSSIPEFFQGRILHLLLLKALLAPVGPGMAGFVLIVAVHLGLLAGFLLTTRRVLAELLPDVATRRAGLILLALSPVVLYFAGKTLADNEALATAGIATLALLRCGQDRKTAAWLPIASVALAATLLIKNQMVLMPASFWAAACLLPIGGMDRRRVAWTGVAAGIAGILLAIAALEILGVGISRYLASYTDELKREASLAAQLLSAATLLGALWVLVPLAVLSRRRRQLSFLFLWAVLATLPLLAVSEDFAARHLAVTLMAAGGLFALALEALLQRTTVWERLSNAAKCLVATAGVLVLMGGNALALALSPFEVEIRQMRAALDMLDARYGPGRYVVLTPWPYTDFHAVRFLWPDVDIRSVGSDYMWTRASGKDRLHALIEWHQGRLINSIQELEGEQRPLVYFGFLYTFPVENLAAMLRPTVGEAFTRKVLAQIDPLDHLAKSWLWQQPGVKFEELPQCGHYRLYRVEVDAPTGATPVSP